MIEEQLLLSKNVEQVCYEVVKLDKSNNLNNRKKIIKEIISFYRQHILGTKNVYSGKFIMTRLKQLELIENDDIYRKALIEIFVYMTICNKPYNKTNNINDNKIKLKDSENILIEELKSFRREDVIMNCIDKLYKSKKELLWDIVKMMVKRSKSQILIDYVEVLNFMSSKDEKKDYMFEAYRCITSENARTYFYDVSEYRSIILQCMLKINYVYEEQGLYNKHMSLYEACMYCPMDILKEDGQIRNIPMIDDIDLIKSIKISKS